MFSVSPDPASFAYGRYLQDWPAWERSGYIEELIVQLYRRNLSGFLPELERPELMAARDHISTAIGILTGLKQDAISGELVISQVQAAKQRGYAGAVFFFYESIWKTATESLAERQAMVRSLFPVPQARFLPLSQVDGASSHRRE